MKERILAAMTAAIAEHEEVFISVRAGDGCTSVDGWINLPVVAEAIARVVGPKTASFTISGEAKASAIGVIIVQMSQWFQFEPMPYGKYQFTIKQELLQRLINNEYVQMQEVNNAANGDVHTSS